MKIYRIATELDGYDQFKKYILNNLYAWSQLPSSFINQKKYWARFFAEYPQFISEEDEKLANDKFIELWQGFLIRNPDLFDFCPIEALKQDQKLKEAIRDFWYEKLVDSPYLWHNIPNYVRFDKMLWNRILQKNPQYQFFVTESKPACTILEG